MGDATETALVLASGNALQGLPKRLSGGNEGTPLAQAFAPGTLCIVKESKEINFSRSQSTYAFVIGNKGLYKDGDQVFLDVLKRRNPLTKENESLCIRGTPERYAIAHADHVELNPGRSSTFSSWNEGTFSTRGWMQHTHHSSRTDEVRAHSPEVKETYWRAFDDIFFRMNALALRIPQEYLPKRMPDIGRPSTPIGNADPALFPDGIQGMYALTQILDEMNSISDVFFGSMSLASKDVERDPKLSDEYFTYKFMGSERIMFDMRIAPHGSSEVWVKPRNNFARLTAAFLPTCLERRYSAPSNRHQPLHMVREEVFKRYAKETWRVTSKELQPLVYDHDALQEMVALYWRS